MKIQRWRPVRDFLSIHDDFDKLVKDFFGRKPELTERFQWSPEVDIIEKKDKFLIKADLPGLDKKDIDISIDNNILSIRGEKKQEKKEEDENHLYIERNYGSFCRSFSIPTEVDIDKIDAGFKNGVLLMELPKLPEEKSQSKKVKIK